MTELLHSMIKTCMAGSCTELCTTEMGSAEEKAAAPRPLVMMEAPPVQPAPRRDDRPDRLNEAERPGAVEESVNRAECAGDREGQNEPRAPPARNRAASW